MITKKTFLLITVAIVLAALYLTYFTDVFKAKNIQIMWRLAPGANPPTVVFMLDKPYSLTSVKVVAVEEAQTNKFAHPLWHLVASSNATPIKGFNYGTTLPGMRPNVPSTTAEPLQPDVSYALLLEAGSVKGKVTFHP